MTRLIGLCISLFLSFGLASLGSAQSLQNEGKAFVSPSDIRKSDWSDPAEMARSWQAAIVRVPLGNGRSKTLQSSQLAGWTPQGGQKVPAVVYLHGCSGIWKGSHYRVKLMADLGFVVAAPASFARKKYAQSCDPSTNNADMFRDVLRLRQYDASYAVQQVRSLPYVDQERVVLMGLSQGGVTTATYNFRAEKNRVTHRIIEGWTCNAGWPEYDGLKARRSEPVLSLVGADDPWYQTKWVRGHCGPAMKRNNGSASVVFNSGKLAQTHALLEHATARSALVQFLQKHALVR